MTLMPDGRILAGVDGKVHMWAKSSDDLTSVGNEFGFVAIGDGRYFTSIRFDARLRPPDGDTGENNYADRAVVAADGRLVTTSGDKLRIWPLDTSKPAAIVDIQGGQRLQALPNGKIAIINDSELQIYDLAAIDAAPSDTGSVNTTARVLRADGRVLLRRGDELTDPNSGQQPEYVDLPIATAIEQLPGGDIAMGWQNGALLVWAADAPSPRLSQTHGNAAINALLALGPHRLASGADNGTIRIWDLAHPNSFVRLDGHRDAINALAVLPDGRLVSGSDDGTVRIWPAVPEGVPLVLEGHGRRVARLAILADGRVASQGVDGTIRIWTTDAVRPPLEYGGFASAVRRAHSFQGALTVLPDGRLAADNSDKQLKVWQPARDGPGLIAWARDTATRCVTPAEREVVFLSPKAPTWCTQRKLWPYDPVGAQQYSVTLINDDKLSQAQLVRDAALLATPDLKATLDAAWLNALVEQARAWGALHNRQDRGRAFVDHAVNYGDVVSALVARAETAGDGAMFLLDEATRLAGEGSEQRSTIEAIRQRRLRELHVSRERDQ